jgi:hypothetical protein
VGRVAGVGLPRERGGSVSLFRLSESRVEVLCPLIWPFAVPLDSFVGRFRRICLMLRASVYPLTLTVLPLMAQTAYHERLMVTPVVRRSCSGCARIAGWTPCSVVLSYEISWSSVTLCSATKTVVHAPRSLMGASRAPP